MKTPLGLDEVSWVERVRFTKGVKRRVTSVNILFLLSGWEVQTFGDPIAGAVPGLRGCRNAGDRSRGFHARLRRAGPPGPGPRTRWGGVAMGGTGRGRGRVHARRPALLDHGLEESGPATSWLSSSPAPSPFSPALAPALPLRRCAPALTGATPRGLGGPPAQARYREADQRLKLEPFLHEGTNARVARHSLRSPRPSPPRPRPPRDASPHPRPSPSGSMGGLRLGHPSLGPAAAGLFRPRSRSEGRSLPTKPKRWVWVGAAFQTPVSGPVQRHPGLRGPSDGRAPLSGNRLPGPATAKGVVVECRSRLPARVESPA